MGASHSGTGTLGWGPGVGLRLLVPELSLLNFYPPPVWGDLPFLCLCISMSPTFLHWCRPFSSVVVGLPLSLISDGSVWSVVCSLVVILVWLCEEVGVFTSTSVLVRSSVFFLINSKSVRWLGKRNIIHLILETNPNNRKENNQE